MAVGALTQLTKELPGIVRIPTQLWSYILALGTLLAALTFGSGFTAEGAALAFFNAALVSLGANGSYSALERLGAGAKRE